jgi:hypothetical protein
MFLNKIKFKGEILTTKFKIIGNDINTNVILIDFEANGKFTNNNIYKSSTIRLQN